MEATVIALIIALVSIVAIFARAKSQIDATRAGGRLVLHHPAPGAPPMALIALTRTSLILDRPSAVAVKRRLDGAAPEPGDAAMLAQIDALAATDLRVGAEIANELPPGKRPGMHLPLRVVQGGPEFTELVASLRHHDVADPGVIAEALLAATDDGASPRLITRDRELIARLQTDAPAAGSPAAVYRPALIATAAVRVSFEGHALEVISLIA